MKRLMFGMAVGATLAFASCQKEETTITDANVLGAIDDQKVSNMSADVDNEVDQVTFSLKDATVADSTGSRKVTTVKNADNSITKTVVYKKWAIGKNKRWVKDGQINVTISADWTTRTVTFTNFWINGHKLDGTKSIVWNFAAKTRTVSMQNGVITFADGTTYKHSFTQVWTQVAGADTPLNIWDDEYDIVSQATGENRKGHAFTEATVSGKPLHLKLIWPMFVSGVTTREVNGHVISTDFGDGTEDFKVVVTVDGIFTTVDLSNLGK